LSVAISLSPCNTLIETAGWLSSAVEKTWLFLVGIVVFFSISFVARIIFGSCCLVMIISVIFFIRDIHLSTETLKLHLSDMKIDLD